MFSEFDTLDALTSVDFYEKRNDAQFVQTHLSKFIMFEFYSKQVCQSILAKWETLPLFIKKRLPDFVLNSSSLSSEELEKQISQFWVKKAILVLEGYEKCAVPFSMDSRVLQSKKNILSPKGEAVLRKLKAINKNEKFAGEDKKAIFAANKFLLDLNLFVSFNTVPLKRFFAQNQDARVTVSMSSGCYNNCAHCAYEAQSPISHMPYPIFLRLTEAFNPYLSEGLAGQMIYSNSDPINYLDPIIDADAADVACFLKNAVPLHLQQGVEFLTKGILTKRDEITLMKLAFLGQKISFSLVDLPNENFSKNKKRILKSIALYRRIRKENECFSVRRYGVNPDKQQADFFQKQNIQFSSVVPVLNGRWASTVKQLGLDEKSFLKKGFGADKNLIFSADGTLWLTSLNSLTHKYEWTQLDDIFNYQSNTPTKRVLKTIKPKKKSASIDVDWSTLLDIKKTIER